jgi:hypothetical protein
MGNYRLDLTDALPADGFPTRLFLVELAKFGLLLNWVQQISIFRMTGACLALATSIQIEAF